MIKFRNIIIALGLVSCLVSNSTAAQNQHTYKMLMSTSPGSGVANTVEKFSACFRAQGHTVIPDFAPGGAGVVAIRKFKYAQDPPDTTTVFIGSFGVNVMGRWPDVDLIEDFNFVGYMNSVNLAMVQKTGRWANINELREASKVKPLNIGYTTLSLKFFTEIFASALNIKVEMIPYKSTPQMTIDGLNGTLDVVVDTYSGIRSHIDSGGFTIITSTFENSIAQKLNHKNVWQINPAAPKVPLGLIISVKPGIEADSKARLTKLIDMCVRDPVVKTFLDQSFETPVQMSGDEIRSLVRKYATHQF